MPKSTQNVHFCVDLCCTRLFNLNIVPRYVSITSKSEDKNFNFILTTTVTMFMKTLNLGVTRF